MATRPSVRSRPHMGSPVDQPTLVRTHRYVFDMLGLLPTDTRSLVLRRVLLHATALTALTIVLVVGAVALALLLTYLLPTSYVTLRHAAFCNVVVFAGVWVALVVVALGAVARIDWRWRYRLLLELEGLLREKSLAVGGSGGPVAVTARGPVGVVDGRGAERPQTPRWVPLAWGVATWVVGGALAWSLVPDKDPVCEFGRERAHKALSAIGTVQLIVEGEYGSYTDLDGLLDRGGLSPKALSGMAPYCITMDVRPGFYRARATSWTLVGREDVLESSSDNRGVRVVVDGCSP